MTIETIIQFILTHYEGSTLIQNDDGIFFYAQEGQTFPFATIVQKDNDFDNLSHLDRDGFFRFNIGISQQLSTDIFGEMSPTSEDWKSKKFDQENVLMPHPIYASLGWISMINPSESSFETLTPYLERAFHAAQTQDAWIRK